MPTLVTRPIGLALMLLIAAGLPVVAPAETAPAETALATPLAATNPAATNPVVAGSLPSEQELQALNFYLQQKDQPSVDAELRRLRIQFPAWVPPDDLSKLAITQPSTEIDTIYRQIADNQLVEARGTVATTQKQYPFWVPPPDMIKLLELAEGQARLDAALDAGNAAEALQIASSVDGLLRCDRVNNAWRIAASQQAQQAGDAALSTYTGVVKACTNFPDIIATLQKSDGVTTDGELASLFAAAQTRFPDKAADLTTLQAELLAGRGVGSGDTGPNGAIGAADLSKFRPQPRPDPHATKTAELTKVPATKAPATKAAARSGGDPGLGRAMTPAQCLAATNAAKSAQSLAQRGWCAYNLNRPMESLAAFQTAQANLGGPPQRDARFGLALSFLKLNMTEEASRIAGTTDLTHQQRVETESIILNQRGVQAFKAQEFAKSVSYFNALEQMKGALPRDLAILRGYAYLNSGNRPKARALFLALHNQLATEETLAALKASE